MYKSKIAMLNHMPSRDFVKSLDLQREWKIHYLDLKEHIFGKELLSLRDDEAKAVAELVSERDMEVYCFSTTLFFEEIEKGEGVFQKEHLEKLDRIIELARIINPKVIRIMAARTAKRSRIINTVPYISESFPWLIPMYRRAVERINAGGYTATIENDANGCIWSRPEEITGFFNALDCAGRVFLTFDIQNLWQMGTYPTMEVFDILEDITGYFHLKGSLPEISGGDTVYACSLEDCRWDVIGITRKALLGKSKSYICLNPVKGKRLEGLCYEDIARADLDYLRNQIKELE